VPVRERARESSGRTQGGARGKKKKGGLLGGEKEKNAARETEGAKRVEKSRLSSRTAGQSIFRDRGTRARKMRPGFSFQSGCAKND